MSAALDEALRELMRTILREELPAVLRGVLDDAFLARSLPANDNNGSRRDGVSALETLHTVREVAEELRVTEPTVRDWIKAGELPARRLGGRGQKRLLRVARAALDEFKRRRFTDGDGHPGSVDEQADDILNTLRAKAAGR